MKRVINFLISLLLVNCNCLYSNYSASGDNLFSGDSLKVLTTPDLYNLSVKWAGEYNRLFPGTKIRVINISDVGTVDDLIKYGNIGFVSNDYYPALKSESIWKMVVGRDVIVPIINSNNPFIEEINEHGISPEIFVRFLSNKHSRTWGTLLDNRQTSPANYYCIRDESAVKSLAGFLNTDRINIAGNKTGSVKEMISSMQKDPYAIGFCKLVDILDFKSQSIVENIRLLPVDRNNNGLIDYNEKIYDDFNAFARGVWIGKYPKALISNIYSVSSSQPENGAGIAFLKWVLTDGQQFLLTNGYSDLLVSERQSAADKLYNSKIYAGSAAGEKSRVRMLLFIIATVILIGLAGNAIARLRKRKKASLKITGSVFHPVLDENSLIVPNGLYFDKTHTWAFLEQDGVVKVGIDDFLQHITGSITRIKMKHQGKKVKKGEQILSIIQNGKQLNLYSPISGTIVEQNISLVTNSSPLNSSPYTDGWIYKIEPSNWVRESQLLFMADKYRQFIKKEFSRLKDFLTEAMQTDTEKYALVILQDGGALTDGVLSTMGPEVWEDFQTKFIDPSRQVWFYEIV